MLSGRAIVTLGLIGLGAYVLRKGVGAAESAAMQGLDGELTQAEIDAEQARGQAMIAAINAIPIVIPPMPSGGPRPWQQVVK